jgi:hypothetical protein
MSVAVLAGLGGAADKRYSLMTVKPAINTTIFPNTPTSYFWSASAFAGVFAAMPGTSPPLHAWVIRFGFGDGNPEDAEIANQVRLVRGGQSLGLLNVSRPTTDYVDNGDGSVTHTPTALTWKRCAEGQAWSGGTCNGTATPYTWAAATALKGTFAGKSDWRLPTQVELRSLVDFTFYGPAINSKIFPNTPTQDFWSSSAVVNTVPPYKAFSAWSVNLLTGNDDDYLYTTSSAQVLLVRGGQAVPTTTVSQPDCLFNWAEKTLPSYFPAGATTQTQSPYTFRYYPSTNYYLATSSSDNHVYYLGPTTGNKATDAGGDLTAWYGKAGCL